MNCLHESLIILLRHEDDAAGILTSDEERRAVIANPIHIGREIVAKLAI